MFTRVGLLCIHMYPTQSNGKNLHKCLLFSFIQLLAIHQKLRNDAEKEDCVSRLDRLNQMRGVDKQKAGGTGFKGTWKKLKGKKKKQRNLTAPEISTQTMKALSEIHALEPVKEKEEKQDGGKTKGGMFGKRSQSREKVNVIKREDSKDTSEQTQTPKGKKKRNSVVSNKNDAQTRPESPSTSEGDALLSQKSDSRLSQQDHFEMKRTPEKLPGSKSVIEISMMEDLSQTSAGKLSLSQSGTFTGPEEQFSTQSSSDTQFGEHLVEERQPSSDGLVTNENHVNSIENEPEVDLEAFRKGSAKLYSEFGDKQHKMNLERVLEFLKSSGESQPANLTLLMDWDGWVLASKQIV